MPNTETTRATSFESTMVEMYGTRLATVVSALRDLAYKVERKGTPLAGYQTDADDRYTHAAINVMHEVTWGVANLNLDTLLSRAVETDSARREARAAR